MSAAELEPYSQPGEARWAIPRAIGDALQWFGISGAISGTNGKPDKTFLYSLGTAAAVVGTVNAINVISIQGMHPGRSLFAPLIDEGSSWLTFMAFFWIIWLGWRLAPLSVRPRWKLCIHAPAALAFCCAHVGGFLLLRTFAYRLAGAQYEYGPLLSRFLYEFKKDAFGYALFFTGITLIDHLLRQQIAPPDQARTFDIRDGTKLSRVMLDDILTVASAGNYVEFALRDGRRLLMRSPLSTIERELKPRGFLRVHRSWIINRQCVRVLQAAGSGDYQIELDGGSIVPLSRRFAEALAQLRAAYKPSRRI